MITVKKKRKLIRFENVAPGTFFSYPEDWTCGCCLKFAEPVRTREEWEKAESFECNENTFIFPGEVNGGVPAEFYSDDKVEIIDVNIEVQ